MEIFHEEERAAGHYRASGRAAYRQKENEAPKLQLPSGSEAGAPQEHSSFLHKS